MMKQAFSDILYNFNVFIGPTKGHLVLYLVSVLAILLLGRKYSYKILYPVILFALIVFNPVVYKIIGEKYLSGVYWRMFWLFPAAATIAVAAAELVCSGKAVWKRVSLLLLVLGLIVATGKPVISRDNFDWAQNEYQLGAGTIAVCDRILEDTDNQMTKAIVPYELLTEVRQYTSRIGLMYGRNVDGYISDADGYDLWAYDIMSSGDVDFESLRTIALYKDVAYIVFNSDVNRVSEDIRIDGYDYVATVDQYIIYKVYAE